MTHHDPRAWARKLTDPALFTREQARLGTAWTLLGLTTDVGSDGDWIRATLGGRSVFVQRFGDTLHAFENVCAHRFYPLRTEDRGNGPVRCGFHHWQYNKEGVATGIPKCAEMFGVTPRELNARLAPVQIATCGALIFGRFPGEGSAQSLEEYLGAGYPILKAMTSVNRVPKPMRLPLAANWKLGYHIALDDYHLVAVHPDTFGKGGYLGSEMVSYYRFGPHSAYFYGGGADALEEMAAACTDGTYRPSGFRTFQFFPNLLALHLDAARTSYVLIQQLVPVAVDRTEMRTWCFAAPFPANDRGPIERILRRLAAPWVRIGMRIYMRKIGREDNAVCERLQTVAAQARGLPRLARHEERIGWFEESYDAWLGAGATGDATPG